MASAAEHRVQRDRAGRAHHEPHRAPGCRPGDAEVVAEEQDPSDVEAEPPQRQRQHEHREVEHARDREWPAEEPRLAGDGEERREADHLHQRTRARRAPAARRRGAAATRGRSGRCVPPAAPTDRGTPRGGRGRRRRPATPRRPTRSVWSTTRRTSGPSTEGSPPPANTGPRPRSSCVDTRGLPTASGAWPNAPASTGTLGATISAATSQLTESSTATVRHSRNPTPMASRSRLTGATPPPRPAAAPRRRTSRPSRARAPGWPRASGRR